VQAQPQLGDSQIRRCKKKRKRSEDKTIRRRDQRVVWDQNEKRKDKMKDEKRRMK
jgi:hypothetical protein